MSINLIDAALDAYPEFRIGEFFTCRNGARQGSQTRLTIGQWLITDRGVPTISGHTLK